MICLRRLLLIIAPTSLEISLVFSVGAAVSDGWLENVFFVVNMKVSYKDKAVSARITTLLGKRKLINRDVVHDI